MGVVVVVVRLGEGREGGGSKGLLDSVRQEGDTPSMRNLPVNFLSGSLSSMVSPDGEDFVMASLTAFSSNAMVTSIGTMTPSLMQRWMSSPNSLPGRSCSARSRSPAERCTKP